MTYRRYTERTRFLGSVPSWLVTKVSQLNRIRYAFKKRSRKDKGFYFLKATELNQRLHDARKYGRESSVINGLVKPSCLIIDEVGRSVFDKENTRMFFDVIDRRYNKDVPNTLILTSNKSPDKWGEFFSEDSSLLCALDRIFDTATVFMIKGNTYRGRKCETVALSTGDASAVPKS